MVFDYTPVKADRLKAGQKIDFEIYFNKSGDLMFLCRDVVLTDEMIEKFKRIISPSHVIYVSKSNLKTFFPNEEDAGDKANPDENYRYEEDRPVQKPGSGAV